MVNPKCIKDAMEGFKITESEATAMAERIEILKKQAAKDNVPFKKFFTDEMATKRKELARRKRHNLRSRESAANLMSNYKSDFELDFEGGPNAIFEFMSSHVSESFRVEGKVGGAGAIPLERLASQYKNRHLSLMEKALHEYPEVFDRFMLGDKDLELKYMRYARGEDIKLADAEKGVFDRAIQAHEVNLQLKNNTGLVVFKKEGRSAKLHHNNTALTEMGFDNWVKVLDESGLDMKSFKTYDPELRTHRQMTPDEVTKSLRKDFDDITGTRDLVLGMEQNPLGRAKQLEFGRKYNFMTSEGELNYRKKAGNSGSVLEGVINDLNKEAEQLASIEKFGFNREATSKNLLAKIKKDLKKRGRMDLVENFNNHASLNEKRLLSMLNEASGVRSMAGDNLFNKTIKGLKAFTENRFLDKAFITTLTDTGFGAVYGNLVSGKNTAAIGGRVLVDTLKRLPKSQRVKFASQFGIFTQGLIDDNMHLRFSGEMIEGGKGDLIDKTRTFLNKATLLSQQSQSQKMALAGFLAGDLADNMDANMKFSDLAADHPGKYKELKKMGWTEETWDFIKQHGIEDFGEDLGRFATPDKVFQASDEVIAKFLKTSKKSAKVQKFKNKIDVALAAYLERGATIGSPESNARLRSMFPDVNATPVNKLLNLALQFKTFPLAVINNVRVLHGLGNSTADKFSNIGRVAAINSVLGSAVLLAKDVANNRDPMHRFKNPVTFGIDAFLQSGTAGLFGDLGGGLYAGRNPFRDLLGPFMGGIGWDVAETVGKVGEAAVGGDLKKAAYHSANLVQRQFPNVVPVPGVMQFARAYAIQPMLEWGMRIPFESEMFERDMRTQSKQMQGDWAGDLINLRR